MKAKYKRKLLNMAETDFITGRKTAAMFNMLLSGLLIGFSLGTLVPEEKDTIYIVALTATVAVWFLFFSEFCLGVYRLYTVVSCSLPNGGKFLISVSGHAVRHNLFKGILKNADIVKKKIEAELPAIIEEEIAENPDAEELLNNTYEMRKSNESSLFATLRIWRKDSKSEMTTSTIVIVSRILKKLEEKIPEVKFDELSKNF